MTINILLVEDQKLIRVGLKSLFEGQDEIIVSSEAQSGKEAVEKFRTAAEKFYKAIIRKLDEIEKELGHKVRIVS